MQALTAGRYVAHLAQDRAEVSKAQALRHRAFHAARGRRGPDALDADSYDDPSRHMLIRAGQDGPLVGCYRVQAFAAAEAESSYSAQFYDLTRLSRFPGRLLEVGRFCLHPDCHDPDVLRLAWAAMARLVDSEGIGLLFGCSSFEGADPAAHGAALGRLNAHVAPARWRPGPRAGERVALCDWAGQGRVKEGIAATPALLRTYLAMGGWVSDHAVVDRDMDTLHVLTGVEIAAIPAARARALRMIGGLVVG